MEGIFQRSIVAAIFALAIGWASAERLRKEFEGSGKDGRRLYSSFSYYAALPLFLLIYAVAVLIALRDTAQNMLLSMFFYVFLTLSVYYIVLAPLIPRLRRHISAWACAALWLLPNLLYITMTNYMYLSEPLFVLELKGELAMTLFYVWFAGFVLVMAWKICEHLSFRRRVLRNAEEVKSELWEEVFRHICGLKAKLPPLMRSHDVTTPLSVGLSRGKMVVLLPVRSYTDEELRLVLTHEAIHIARSDSYSKFALVSIAALCWFNPLVWLAMRKSAEDIELSCDESVTFGAGADERRRYADLILSSAGDGRGFTTCLSAKASSLRYRLKNVMQPAMKSSGALVIGIATFLLILSCGQVALAYGGGTGEELIFNSDDPARYVVDERECTDPDGLKAYIAALELRELTSGYDFDYGPDIQHRGMLFDTPNGQLYIGFFDNILEYLGPGSRRIVYYYLPEGTDWARLDSFFDDSTAGDAA